MNKALFLLLPILFLLSAVHVARADSVTPGEMFSITGTATQTGGSSCCTHGGTFDGSFIIGSEIGSSTDWTVSAFGFTGCNLGADSCSSVTWTLTGLEFDESNDTLIGDVSAKYTGNGGDSRGLDITFEDGNTTDDPYTSPDFTNISNSRNGTISYSVSAVPEPPTALLLGFALLLGLGVRRMISKPHPGHHSVEHAFLATGGNSLR